MILPEVKLFTKRKKKADVYSTSLLEIFVSLPRITIENLIEYGKTFKYGICICQNCNRPMWGHGYTRRYFNEIADPLFLKRFRCVACNKVITIRPTGYWPYIRSSIEAIYKVLKDKLIKYSWQFVSRQRGGHWLNRFGLYARMEGAEDFVSFLQHCFHKEIRFLT